MTLKLLLLLVTCIIPISGKEGSCSFPYSSHFASQKCLSLRAGDSNSKEIDSVGLLKMPSLFTLPDEKIYDSYAACLAATESLRRFRDDEVAMFNGGLLRVLSQGNKEKQEKLKAANARYIVNSSRVIKAFGLSLSQFNALGKEVRKSPILQKKVMEQASLYRIASAVTMPRSQIKLKEFTPESNEIPTISESKITPTKTSKYELFAKTLNEMECTRQDQIDRLCRAIHVDSIPFNVCQGDVLKVLHPKVKAVCQAFPHQAEEIMKKNGFEVDDFNKMLKDMKSNPFVKRKVNRYLKQLLDNEN